MCVNHTSRFPAVPLRLCPSPQPAYCPRLRRVPPIPGRLFSTGIVRPVPNETSETAGRKTAGAAEGQKYLRHHSPMAPLEERIAARQRLTKDRRFRDSNSVPAARNVQFKLTEARAASL